MGWKQPQWIFIIQTTRRLNLNKNIVYITWGDKKTRCHLFNTQILFVTRHLNLEWSSFIWRMVPSIKHFIFRRASTVASLRYRGEVGREGREREKGGERGSMSQHEIHTFALPRALLFCFPIFFAVKNPPSLLLRKRSQPEKKGRKLEIYRRQKMLCEKWISLTFRLTLVLFWIIAQLRVVWFENELFAQGK